MIRADGQHIQDGDLLRLIGDEVSIGERAAAADHLQRCTDCARRLEALRAELNEVAGLLAITRADAVDPARRARSRAAVQQAAVRKIATRQASRRRFAMPGLMARAAAVAGLLVATGLAASTVGPWIVRQAQELFRDEPAVVVAPEPAALSVRGSVVAFAPTGADFEIVLATGQEGGSLTLRVSDTRSASARLIGDNGELDVVVLPASLRIANHAAATADYEIVVPAHLTSLRVRVGDAEELVLAPAELGAGWSAVIGLRHGQSDPAGGPL
jgi:anti-sigma factor RsiW